jgi:RNA polymerase sigma-70 factor (ECF subfamily)
VVTDDAFTQLVAEHHTEIFRYLMRVTGRPSDADDLSQETFLRAFRAHASQDPFDPRAWLFAIATNLIKNHFRAQKRRRRAHDALAQRVPSGPDRDGEVSGRDVGEVLERIVAGLPLKQRLAFVQRKVHGFEYEVIAQNLGCSQESARANVFQATKKIRRALDGHSADRKEES